VSLKALKDGQTDRRTDISLIAKTGLHRCSAVKSRLYLRAHDGASSLFDYFSDENLQLCSRMLLLL